MDNNQYIELKVFMERQSVSMENLEKDIDELKALHIENGQNRMEICEGELKSLNRFKNGSMAVLGLILVCLPFLSKYIGE